MEEKTFNQSLNGKFGIGFKGSLTAAVALVVGVVAVTVTKPVAAEENSIVGLGPGLFIQDSDQTFTATTGSLVEDDEAWVSDGLLNLNAWWLTPALVRNLRVGAGVSWFNSYTLYPEDGEEPEEGELCEETDDCWKVGHLFHLTAQAEYVLPEVVGPLDVFLGLRAGVLAAFASGELNDEVERLENEGYNVYPSLPRTGGVVGPHAGVAWPLAERLAIRADVGVQFTKLWLWDGEVQVNDYTFSNASDLSTTRYQLTLGVDLTL